MIKTVTNKSLINISLTRESALSGPDPESTTSMPMIPKMMDEYMNICVAIFCMVLFIYKFSF